MDINELENLLNEHGKRAREHISPNAHIESEDIMNKKIIKHSFKILPVAACIAVIGSVTAAAATFNWHEKLIDYFNPTQEQMETLNGGINTPNASQSKNGITFTVLQTIADKHNIYALIELTAPEGSVISEETADNIHLDIDTEQPSSQVFIEAIGHSVISSSDGNKMTVILHNDFSSDIITSQKLKASLDSVQYTKNGELFTVEGPWETEWDFIYKDSTKVFNVNKKLILNETNNNILTKIEISPMSFWVFTEGDDVIMSLKPVIKLKNGEIIELEKMDHSRTHYLFSNFQDREGGISTVGGYFDKIINLSDIESITVGNITVPVN